MPGGLRALVLDTFSFLSSGSKRAGTWKTQKLLRRTQRGAASLVHFGNLGNSPSVLPSGQIERSAFRKLTERERVRNPSRWNASNAAGATGGTRISSTASEQSPSGPRNSVRTSPNTCHRLRSACMKNLLKQQEKHPKRTTNKPESPYRQRR